MKKLFALLLVAVSLVGAGAYHIVAYASDVSEKYADFKVLPVKFGVYKELNFLRKVKLGAAPYVAPKSLKHISVVWKYDPESFKNVKWGEMESLLKDGYATVVFSSPNDDVWKIANHHDMHKAINGGKADWLNAIREALDGMGIRVVSYSKNLFDKKPTGSLISWDASDFEYGG